jgi:hypothetical protein
VASQGASGPASNRGWPTQSTIIKLGHCPYVGLKTFQPEDAKLFFGRAAKIQELVYGLRKDFGTPKEERFLCLVGASGSGKSSLALAGLVPAVRRGELPESVQWPLVLCRPGIRPWENLQIALANDPYIGPHLAALPALITRPEDEPRRLHLTARLALHARPETHRLFVLIDQFEEIFTLCNDEEERRRLIDNVLYATSIIEGRTVAVLTLRGDFFDKCANYLGLRAAVADHQLLIGPLRQDELREVIEAPAQLAGGELEPGFLELLLSDMKGQTGALPLLEHALFKLWELRDGRRLTAKAYSESGRLQGALDVHAEEFFTQVLTAEEREWCRRMLVDLVHPGEGAADTKKRVTLDDLAPTEAARSVLKKLADARLVTTDREAPPKAARAELAHEALIGGWHRLGDWVNQNREKSRLKERLFDAAREWQKSGKKGDYLYRGAQLVVAEEHFGRGREPLPPLVKQFLETSVAQRKRERRLRRWVLSAVAIIPFILIASVLYGIQQVSLLKANEQLREIGDVAKRQSKGIYTRAEALLKDKNDPRAPAVALALLSQALDRDTHNVAAAERACTLLLDQSWCPPLTPPLRYSSESPILCATFYPEGDGNRVLAVSQDGWLLRSDDQGRALVPTERLTQEVDGKNTRLISASFSGDGRALVFIWPLSNGLKRVEFCRYANGKYQPVTTVEINDYSVYSSINWSADDNLLTITPLRWDGTGLCRAYYFDGTSYVGLDKPFGDSQVVAVAFAPGANLVATASAIGSTGSLQLWEWKGGSFKQLPDTPESHSRYNLPDRHIRSLVFGKTKEELFIVTFAPSGDVQVQRVNVPMNRCENLGFAAEKDQFVRLVTGPSTGGRCLIATSLYQRISTIPMIGVSPARLPNRYITKGRRAFQCSTRAAPS